MMTDLRKSIAAVYMFTLFSLILVYAALSQSIKH